jgi:hypothetical protein
VRARHTFASVRLPATAVLAVGLTGCEFDGSPIGDAGYASLDAALVDAQADATVPDDSSPDAPLSEAAAANPAADATLGPDGPDASPDAEFTPAEDSGPEATPADAATDVQTDDVQTDAVAASIDAAPSGPVAACSDSDSGPTATSDPGEGCADGTREGLEDGTVHPDVAACAGTWTGTVDQAQSLCAGGWHVCLGSEPALTSVAFNDGIAFCGCFAFDAAQDNYTCNPGCEAAVNAGVDTAGNIDMAGLGATCNYQFSGAGSCITGGRIDASENSGTGCNFTDGLSGVVCCRNAMDGASDSGGE